MTKLDAVKRDHLAGKHFSWTNCPWCWAQINIQAALKISSVSVLCVMMTVPAFAEQVVLDGKEFRAHLDKDQLIMHERDALRVDRDNLEQQVTLYRQNETNYKQVIKRLKELDAKTTEQSKAQQELLDSYQAREERNAAREQELIAEVRKVKGETQERAWRDMAIASVVTALIPPAWRWVKLIRWR